jgi:hypothetical protein
MDSAGVLNLKDVGAETYGSRRKDNSLDSCLEVLYYYTENLLELNTGKSLKKCSQIDELAMCSVVLLNEVSRYVFSRTVEESENANNKKMTSTGYWSLTVWIL